MLWTDSTGRAWDLRITVGASKRLKAIGVDLSAMLSDPRNLEITADPIRLVEIAYAILQPPDVTFDQFAEAVDGDTIETLQDAFFESFADFCPSRLREPLRELARKTTAVKDAAGVALKKEEASISIETLIALAGLSASTPAS